MIILAGFLPNLNKNGTKQATIMPDNTENNNIKPRFSNYKVIVTIKI